MRAIIKFLMKSQKVSQEVIASEAKQSPCFQVHKKTRLPRRPTGAGLLAMTPKKIFTGPLIFESKKGLTAYVYTIRIAYKSKKTAPGTCLRKNNSILEQALRNQ